MSQFSKKDYEMVANILAEVSQLPKINFVTLVEVYERFVRRFRLDNGRFDLDKFKRAVWEGGEKDANVERDGRNINGRFA